MSQTIIEIFEKTKNKVENHPALYRRKGQNQWESISWKEYYEQTLMVARAFAALGLQPGDGVAILGKNCVEWVLADIGAIAAGGVPAGIYPTCSADQCIYIADHCEASIVVVENLEKLERFELENHRKKLPSVKAFILMEGKSDHEMVYSWEDLKDLAQKVPTEDIQTRINNQKPEDLATLVYTSGTTGNPKGVMLNHKNIVFMCENVMKVIQGTEEDILLSYLPLNHIAEQMVSIHGPLATGMKTYFCESIDDLGENLKEVRPTLFLGVPRVWEKILDKMVQAGAQASPLKRKIAKWAKNVGLEAGYANQKGKPFPFSYKIAQKLVYSKVREKLGLDRCRYHLTAAAPISKETLEFFLSLGIPIFEAYGLSEVTGPATISIPGRYKTGRCGYAIPGTEIKIADDGEILIRGPHVFEGYLKNPEATKEAIDSDGWFHSGDVGELDSDGFLKITDRKKDILITAGGENIAPQMIEGKLTGISVVGHAVVVGDRKKFLSALITLNSETVSEYAEKLGSAARKTSDLANCEKIREHIEGEIHRVNDSLARVQTIKKFKILSDEFTIESGELTPTMKLKRKFVTQKYSPEIESFYN